MSDTPATSTSWTLAQLQAYFPAIDWLDPLPIYSPERPDDPPHYACRICIARHGLKGIDVPALPADIEAARTHIRQHLG